MVVTTCVVSPPLEFGEGESPTFWEIIDAKVLLDVICLLKDRGLTAEVVVADFVFKNIQPLKDRIYPVYLYTGISDSTRVTNRKIPNEDLLSRLYMIMRGRVSNIGAPSAYSAWNLPPNRPFSEFASNPPIRDGSPGHRVWPSPEDIEDLIAPLQSLPKDERQTRFEMPASIDDAEMDVVLSLLARESSDSTHTESMAIMTGQEFGKDVEIWNPKVPTQSVHAEWTARLHLPRRKRKRGDFDDCRAWIRMLVLPCQSLAMSWWTPFPRLMPEVVMMCGLLFDEDEEEEVPLIHKNSRHYRGSDGGSDIPSQALSALVSLQGLSILDFD
jgi:hypothetical protein